jgi:maltose alpha-D-glucosyltransferase / alpha-amylase
VRTPMQWSFDRNGGFSRADPARLYLPPIMDPVYGFEAVNVEAQSRSPSSLLNWVKRLIAARRSRRAFGRGTLRFLYPSNRKVIAYIRAYGDEIVLCVANLSRSPQAVELDLSDWRGRQPIELLGRSAFPPIGELPYMLTLQGHSFFWFELLTTAAEAASLRTAPPEFVTLVMPNGWVDLFRQHNLPQLERDVIPAFLPRQRWFGAKDQRVRGAALLARGEVVRLPEEGSGPETFMAGVVEAQFARGGQRYFLPLATIWSTADTESRQALVPATLAELRQFRREGALVDALSQDGFSLAMMEAIRQESSIRLEGGEIRCRKTPIFDQVPPPERLVLRRSGVEQSNSSVIFDDYGILKIYRRLQPGPHPEIEMTRFLVERAGFANTPSPLATLELFLDGIDGPEPHALGVLFAFVRNQGDGWTQALDYLKRYLDDTLLSAGHTPADLPDPDVFFLTLARQLGIRTAEMHRALGQQCRDDPDFDPEPITAEDIAEWRRELESAAADMLSALERERAKLPAPAQELAERVLALRDGFFRQIRLLIPDAIEACKTRFHGDFHLGQVLVVKNDFIIVDFEGEPTRPLAERRRKSSPLRDVAGMIRSFDYASFTAVRQLAEARPAAEPRMVQLAEAWRQRAVDGFRAAYRKTMRGCAAYPASKRQARELVAFFTLEKAVYEVSYELANRPDWADIPLRGVLGILAKLGEAKRAAAA